MNIEFIKTNLIILFATIVFGYVLGMSVIKTVDNRLSTISINMPKINVPPQNIYVTTDDNQNILVNNDKGQNIEGFTVNDLEHLKNLKNKDDCMDVYSKWSNSKGNSIKKKYPKCFKKSEINKRVKTMNKTINALKKVGGDIACKNVKDKTSKIKNKDAKKLAKRMFSPCYTEEPEINESFLSYGKIDGSDECEAIYKPPPRQPTKIEKLEEYKKAFNMEDDDDEMYDQLDDDSGMMRNMNKEEREEDERMERELLALRDKVKNRIENEKNRPNVCKKDEDCNEFYGDGQNICKSDGKCYCLKGSGSLCQKGPTNYMDPKDMTKEQRERFKKMLDFSKMTIQDYTNWLNLYKHKLKDLNDTHIINMQKLKKGAKLTLFDIPKANISPERNVHSYFAKLWETGYAYGVNEKRMKDKILSYNYSDYEEYIPPKGLEDYKVINPDLVYKKDPVAVNNFLMPRDSSVETEKLIKKSRNKSI